MIGTLSSAGRRAILARGRRGDVNARYGFACNLLYLYQDYGEAFVHRLLAHHPHPELTWLMDKLRVFNACDHIRTIAAARRDGAGGHAIQESVDALSELLEQG